MDLLRVDTFSINAVIVDLIMFSSLVFLIFVLNSVMMHM